jgi:hypothetical protein
MLAHQLADHQKLREEFGVELRCAGRTVCPMRCKYNGSDAHAHARRRYCLSTVIVTYERALTTDRVHSSFARLLHSMIRQFSVHDIGAHKKQCRTKLHSCTICPDPHADMPYAQLLRHYESIAEESSASEVARMLIRHTESDPKEARHAEASPPPAKRRRH